MGKKCLVYYINDYIFYCFAFRVYIQKIYNLSWNWFYVMANSSYFKVGKICIFVYLEPSVVVCIWILAITSP